MANVKYGSIVTEIKGKLGGQNYKATRQGGVVQTGAARSSGGKITKADAGRVTNPNQNLGSVSTSWKALSDEERLNWDTAAVNFPFYNKFGDSYVATGFQVFTSFNTALLMVGESPIEAPPEATELEPCVAFEMTDTGVADFSIVASSAATAGYVYAVYATTGVSPGRKFDKNKAKMIKVITAAEFTAGIGIGGFYQAVFGAPNAGAFIWLQIVPTKIDDGRRALPYLINFSTT